MGLQFFSPFSHLPKNKYPSISLHTSFQTKIKNTYYAIIGYFFEKEPPHVGLYDYLTLFIPMIAEVLLGLMQQPFLYLFEDLYKHSNRYLRPLCVLALPFIALFFIPSLILDFVRVFTGSVGVLLSMPIIASIHFYSSSFYRSYSENLTKSLNLKGSYVGENNTLEFLTLEKYLKDTGQSLEDLDICVEKRVGEEGGASYRFVIRKISSHSDSKDNSSVRFLADTTRNRREDVLGLLQTNLGKISDHIQESEKTKTPIDVGDLLSTAPPNMPQGSVLVMSR